jgi:ketosteroid isomerase-like protein/predicted enzyme related to lactoylglutathione lyase
MNKEIITSFIKQINLHDSEALAALMTEDHQFIDAQGKSVSGRDNLKSGWIGYFQWFPDYKIEAENMFENGETVMISGFASGTFKYSESQDGANHWRLPAAWRAVISNGKIKVWQVYADTKIPFDIMSLSSKSAASSQKKGVTGIGGIFFKAEDPEKLKAWYAKHLQFELTEWGGVSFQWREVNDPEHIARTEWSIMKAQTTYLDPGTKPFMINYRVSDLEGLIAGLRSEGVTVMDKIEDTEYGKFGWIIDPEGQKVELWEPKGE